MPRRPSEPRPAPLPAVVNIMHKHGLPEPSARSIALLAFGEGASNG